MRVLSTIRPVSVVVLALGVLAMSMLALAPLLVDSRRLDDIISWLPWRGERDPGESSGVTLPGVFTYQQQRSLSCEYASVSIATTMLGKPVSEYEFDELIPPSDNPHWGYRGDINGTWGNTDDYGVYAEPLAEALTAVGFAGEIIYGQRGDLARELDRGRPTVVWLGMWGDGGSFDAYADDGTRFQLTTGMHVMVAYGYDETGVYLTDPGTAVLRHYDWPTFESMWSVMDGMALSVHP